MRLDDCYRVLDLPEGAAEDEVRRAHRELTKVWHPDRFAHDPMLRQRAEDKLKEINEAFETILGMRRESHRRPRADEKPSQRQTQVRYRSWAVACTAFAVLILLRRPTPGMLAVAAVLFCLAFYFLRRMARVR